MARPIKEGLQYFPLDVDIDQDDKILVIEAIHGIEGFGVLIKLLMKVYKEGYFYKWSKREQLIFSKRVNVNINSVESIVSDSLEEGFFDKGVFHKHGVLTSKGIQVRYLEAITRRKVVYFDKRYLLIDPHNHIPPNAKIEVVLLDQKSAETEVTGVNVYNNSELPGVNDNISTQSKEEYIKEEDIKQYQQEEPKKEEPKKEPQPKNAVDDSVISFYQNNGFGHITPHVGNKVFAWVDDLNEPLVIHAMEKAIEAGVLKWNYVETILKDWFNKKITSVEEVQAIDIQRKQQQTPYKGRVVKDEKVPDWLEKQKADRAKGILDVDEVTEEYMEAKRALEKKLGIKEDPNE